MEPPEIIFICGSHKSGTTLLKSLFDGHKDIFAIPFETHIIKALGKWVYYPLNKQKPIDRDLDQVKEKLIEHVAVFNAIENDEMGGVGNMNLFEKFDLEFIKNYLDKDYMSIPELIIDYFKAIYLSMKNGKRVWDKSIIVEKTVGQSEYAVFLKKMFPKAKFIHILRNPYSNLVSIRRYSEARLGTYPPIYPIIDALEFSTYMLEKNKDLMNEDYSVIKYENLLMEPEKTIQDLCYFLGVEFSPILMKPTVNGEPWVGNSSRGEKFRGIEPSNLDKWKKEITSLEIEWINLRLRHVLEDNGYPIIGNRKSPWRRMKGERLKTFFVNRMAFRLDKIKYSDSFPE